MTDVQGETVIFEAADGWKLAGDLYVGPEPQIAIMISAGTGFPRRFYRHLAAYLARLGAVVLTYDYRGIGGSSNGSLPGSSIELPDWGRYDMTAAVEILEQAAPGLPITHIGHSVGGHFLGIMPNQHKIARNAFIAVGSGYFGHHHLRNWPMELYFWWALGTYSLMRHGYVKSIGGWRGEALPPKVFQTWRKWSHRSDYFGSEIETTLHPQHYAKVASPIRSWLFSDDPIATAKANEVLLQIYPNAQKSRTIKTLDNLRIKRAGHDGAFKPGFEKLWEEVFEWLLQSGDRPDQTSTTKKPAPLVRT